MKNILYRFIHYFHIIFNYRRCHNSIAFFNKIYSIWIQNEFKSCGKNCYLAHFQMLKGAQNIQLGNNIIIGKNCILETYTEFQDQRFTPSLIIKDNSNVGDDSHITCINKIIIGKNVLMGRKIFITDNAHGASEKKILELHPNMRPLTSKGPVIIEDDVWIGEMVCIMPGVTIGQGSIIGANAVVTKDIPSYCVAGGNPAKVIKQL